MVWPSASVEDVGSPGNCASPYELSVLTVPVVVCVVVALWRPSAAWAERLVTPAGVPREPEPLPAPRKSPDARTP